MSAKTKSDHFRSAGLLILLVIAIVASALFWVDGQLGEKISEAISGGPEKVVQCLYEEEGDVPGNFKNVVYDSNRHCFSITYYIPGGIRHTLIPSYGEKRESLKFTLPTESNISETLRRIHGVQSRAHIQIRPSHFHFSQIYRINSDRNSGRIELSKEDERFSVVTRPASDGDRQTRLYYSNNNDQFPFRLLCASTRVSPDGEVDHGHCLVWTRTCNGLTLKYTIFGNPFNTLTEVDGAIQEYIKPLFDQCG